MDQLTPSSADLTILVIDDQSIIRTMIRGVLRKVGIENVVLAEDGKQAFDILDENDKPFPDIIICDLHMEEISGTEFVHKLRRNKDYQNPDVPVIMLTGESNKMVLDVARQVGVSALMHKPVSAQELRENIEKIVGFQIEPDSTGATLM